MKKLTKRKAFNFLRSYFDVLNEIPDKEDKLEFLLALINKQFLGEEPEGLNFIVNLCYESQRHQIEESVKGWERATGQTLTDTPSTPCQTPSVTTPSTPKQEEKEEEKEKGEEKEERKKEKVFNFRLALVRLGVEEQVATDWMKVRKTKKATNTQTAFNNLVSQIDKSGKSANECITLCVVNSWSGFKAEYIKEKKSIVASGSVGPEHFY